MVKIMLDKERTLKFTLNSLILLQNRYGDSSAAIKKLQEGDLTAFRDVLWAALVHEDPSLKPEDVGRMVNFEDICQIAEIIKTIAGSINTPAGRRR
ncbi:MAG: hypothetical protein AB1796_11805 [Bacillota bacterium]|jgi:hypothetical protein